MSSSFMTKCPDRENQGFQRSPSQNLLRPQGRSLKLSPSITTHQKKQITPSKSLSKRFGLKMSPSMRTSQTTLLNQIATGRKTDHRLTGELPHADLTDGGDRLAQLDESKTPFFDPHITYSMKIEPDHPQQLDKKIPSGRGWGVGGRAKKLLMKKLTVTLGAVCRTLLEGTVKSNTTNETAKAERIRALRQRAFQGGVIREHTLEPESVTPPWNVQSLAAISFINPLRFAPIAKATTGLIQAKSLH